MWLLRVTRRRQSVALRLADRCLRALCVLAFLFLLKLLFFNRLGVLRVALRHIPILSWTPSNNYALLAVEDVEQVLVRNEKIGNTHQVLSVYINVASSERRRYVMEQRWNSVLTNLERFPAVSGHDLQSLPPLDTDAGPNDDTATGGELALLTGTLRTFERFLATDVFDSLLLMDDDVDDILVDTWVYTVEEVSELATRYLGAWGVIRLGYSFRLNKRMRLQFQFPFLWSDQPLPLFGSFANLYSRKFAETALQIYGYQNGKITKFPDTRKPYQVDVGLITGTLQDAGLQQAIVFPQMFTVDVLEWLTQTNLRSPLGLSADDEIAFGNVDGLNVLSRLATVYNGMSHLRATNVAVLASRVFADVYRSFREMQPDLPRDELLALTFRYIGRWRRDVVSRVFNIHSGYYDLELEVPEMLGLVVD